jgi:translation elongation factor P/translation initiation factor 5A
MESALSAPERLEDAELEKRELWFLYSDGGNCIFQRLDSFEQLEFPAVPISTGF